MIGKVYSTDGTGTTQQNQSTLHGTDAKTEARDATSSKVNDTFVDRIWGYFFGKEDTATSDDEVDLYTWESVRIDKPGFFESLMFWK